MADNERFTVDKKVKVLLFYGETKNAVATQRLFLEISWQNGSYIEHILR